MAAVFRFWPISKRLLNWTAGRVMRVCPSMKPSAHSGRASLRVDLNTDLYSGPALRYFPGNWQGWKRISFNIYNPDTEPIRLVCKINDRPPRCFRVPL